MLNVHLESAPESKYIGTQEITIKRLDEVFPVLRSEAKNIMLKLDVQGFEQKVLLGAGEALVNIDIIQLKCP